MNKIIVIVFAVLLGITSAIIAIHHFTPTDKSTSGLTVADLLSDHADHAFATALPGQALHFPTDHGPHPQFRNEWWYITGNVFDQQQRRYGFQLTFFRRLLAPTDKPPGWQDNTISMAHFALSNHSTGEFIAREKWGRSGGSVAGAQGLPFKVWLDDWQIYSLTSDQQDLFPLQLHAQHGHVSLDLQLSTLKPMTLQGQQGYSEKSAGNASYYYSYTRLHTTGTINYAGQQFTVTGNSWMDREWSSRVLSSQQQGWDWFALQLHNGDDVMFFQLRHNDGSTSQFDSGTVVTSKYKKIPLSKEQVKITPRHYWASPSGQRFPIVWTMVIKHPHYRSNWTIKATLPNQYLDLSIPYWEGAIDIYDSVTQQLVGLGFLEMTGY